MKVKFLIWFAVAAGFSLAGETAEGIYYADQAPTLSECEEHSLICWTKSFSEGMLTVHYVRLDLESDEYELTSLIGRDIDGDGPGESSLHLPETYMASNATVLVAVNANAFRTPLDPINEVWWVDKAVDIYGFAVSRERNVSESRGAAFWLDKAGKAHVGVPASFDNVLLGVGAYNHADPLGNGQLLKEGKDVFVYAGGRNPRSAVGVDKSGRWVTLVVADGRRKGYSKGATLREMAEIMRQCGCYDAINMDGGGSSIMIAPEGTSLKMINRPSGNKSRPIPIMLGIRSKE